MDITSQEIESIVRKVISGIDQGSSQSTQSAYAQPQQASFGQSIGVSAIPSYTQRQAQANAMKQGGMQSAAVQSSIPAASPAVKAPGRSEDGVFDNVEDAIEAAYKAQREWINNYKVEDRQRVIEAIRRWSRTHIEEWCLKIVAETGMGRYEDKVAKHLAVINKTPGTECLTTHALTGDNGLMLEEYGPFGVIAAITPTTNPTETIINNSISMIAGGNSVVFNVHPRAKKVCAECLQVINKAIVDAGGPENLVTMTKEPTMDNVDKLAASPKIRMMVGTGGMGMVNALLRSGKKCIGAGEGNPPVIVDETADIELAGRKIYEGASFDNNIVCFAEKEVFAVESVYDGLIYELKKNGAYLVNAQQAEQLTKLCVKPKKSGNGYEPNKDFVGKNASEILLQIGVSAPESCRLVIMETEAEHPFVLCEQLMPVLPIVKVRDFEEAVRQAVKAERGNRHTASMYSKNVDHMTVFAKAIETTIFVKNSATKAGLGIGGEGHCTMTIAGPTGEGITDARSFCRKRRCVLAEGGLRIV